MSTDITYCEPVMYNHQRVNHFIGGKYANLRSQLSVQGLPCACVGTLVYTWDNVSGTSARGGWVRCRRHVRSSPKFGHQSEDRMPGR